VTIRTNDDFVQLCSSGSLLSSFCRSAMMTLWNVCMSFSMSPSETLLIHVHAHGVAERAFLLCRSAQQAALADDAGWPRSRRALLVQIIDDPLNVLAIGAHVARQPSNRLWVLGGGDHAEDLPTCAREAQTRDKSIARSHKEAVEPE
jgi:hypothetical protein